MNSERAAVCFFLVCWTMSVCYTCGKRGIAIAAVSPTHGKVCMRCIAAASLEITALSVPKQVVRTFVRERSKEASPARKGPQELHSREKGVFAKTSKRQLRPVVYVYMVIRIPTRVPTRSGYDLHIQYFYTQVLTKIDDISQDPEPLQKFVDESTLNEWMLRVSDDEGSIASLPDADFSMEDAEIHFFVSKMRSNNLPKGRNPPLDTKVHAFNEELTGDEIVWTTDEFAVFAASKDEEQLLLSSGTSAQHKWTGDNWSGLDLYKRLHALSKHTQKLLKPIQQVYRLYRLLEAFGKVDSGVKGLTLHAQYCCSLRRDRQPQDDDINTTNILYVPQGVDETGVFDDVSIFKDIIAADAKQIAEVMPRHSLLRYYDPEKPEPEFWYDVLYFTSTTSSGGRSEKHLDTLVPFVFPSGIPWGDAWPQDSITWSTLDSSVFYEAINVRDSKEYDWIPSDWAKTQVYQRIQYLVDTIAETKLPYLEDKPPKSVVTLPRSAVDDEYNPDKRMDLHTYCVLEVPFLVKTKKKKIIRWQWDLHVSLMAIFEFYPRISLKSRDSPLHRLVTKVDMQALMRAVNGAGSSLVTNAFGQYTEMLESLQAKGEKRNTIIYGDTAVLQKARMFFFVSVHPLDNERWKFSHDRKSVEYARMAYKLEELDRHEKTAADNFVIRNLSTKVVNSLETALKPSPPIEEMLEGELDKSIAERLVHFLSADKDPQKEDADDE